MSAVFLVRMKSSSQESRIFCEGNNTEYCVKMGDIEPIRSNRENSKGKLSSAVLKDALLSLISAWRSFSAVTSACKNNGRTYHLHELMATTIQKFIAHISCRGKDKCSQHYGKTVQY